MIQKEKIIGKDFQSPRSMKYVPTSGLNFDWRISAWIFRIQDESQAGKSRKLI